jgi:translation initiation factor 4E
MCINFDNLWILWYDKKNLNVGTDDWDKFLVRISSVQKIERFCNLLGKIIPLSQLPNGASYHFFKKDVEPRWEDKQNLEGGRWNLILHKQNICKADKIWFLTLSGVMGNFFKSSIKPYITGVVGTVKKGQIRIAIWTKKHKNKILQLRVGNSWKKLINESKLLKKFIIEYFPHQTQFL